MSSRFFCVFSAIARMSRCSHRFGVRFDTLRCPESIVNTMVLGHFRVFRKKPKNPKFPSGNLTFFGRSGSERPPKKTRSPLGGFFWSLVGVLLGPKKRSNFEANFGADFLGLQGPSAGSAKPVWEGKGGSLPSLVRQGGVQAEGLARPGPEGGRIVYASRIPPRPQEA